MSWFGSNKHGGHNAYNNPNSHEFGHVHRPVIVDHKGVQQPILGYERHNEQYVAKTEHVLRYTRFPGMDDEEYIPSWTEEYETGDLSGRKREFSPNFHHGRVRGPIKDSPRENGFRYNSPPSKDHPRATHGKSDNLYFDTNYREGYCVNNIKGTKPNNMKEHEYYEDEKSERYGFPIEGSGPNYHKDYYERVNPKRNDYSPPRYTVPISTHQDKDKGNDYATWARMGPFGTPPRNETSNFTPIANSPPQFNPQHRKEQGNYNKETIDSNEARRRYGKGGAPGAGPGLRAEDKYSGGTIDSKEAARRYKGVFLTN